MSQAERLGRLVEIERLGRLVEAGRKDKGKDNV